MGDMPSPTETPSSRGGARDPGAAMHLSKQETFGALVAGVSEYAIFLLDEQGRILSWNRGAQRVKLFPEEEAVGQHIGRLYLPEDVAAGLPEVILERAADRGSDVTRGWRLRRDGSRFWACVVTTALYDERGRVRGYLKIVGDESARRAEEQQREAALQWMRAFADCCPVGLLWLAGPEEQRIRANRCAAELLGEPSGDLATEPLRRRLLYPDGQPVPPEETPLRRALRGETVAQAEELLVRRPDGRTVPVAGSAAPVLDDEGRVAGAIAAFYDLSAVKRLEQRREHWSALVAHELRQPLGAIVASVGRLIALRGDEVRLHQLTEVIIRNARRLDRMIQDLMDLSRIESGQLQVEVRGIDVEGHVRAAADRAAAGTPDRHVVVHTHGALPAARADPDRLDQILDNLLTNAVRYGDPGTDVTIDVESVPDGVAVAVTNRGAGIAAEQMPRLFQPFQHDFSAARVRESLGLGLYITKGLVDAQGGRIAVTSSPGEETTFRFVLPAAA